MVETATTWSGSRAWRRPSTNPSATALQRRVVMGTLRYGIGLSGRTPRSHRPGVGAIRLVALERIGRAGRDRSSALLAVPAELGGSESRLLGPLGPAV